LKEATSFNFLIVDEANAADYGNEIIDDLDPSKDKLLDSLQKNQGIV